MKLHALIIVLLATGCAAPGSGNAVPEAPAWKSSQLNVRKKEMDGAEVGLDAFLVHEPESYGLWDSEAAWKSGDSSLCISLIYPKGVAEAVHRSNRKQVLLHGTFVRNVTADGGLYLGLCNYTGLRVSGVSS